MWNIERNTGHGEDATAMREDGVGDGVGPGANDGHSGGIFSRNPLMGNLIRPLWKSKDEVKGKDKVSESDARDADKENLPRQNHTWRRVQDDDDDNEAVILDGGVYGGGRNRENDWVEHGEEPAYG